MNTLKQFIQLPTVLAANEAQAIMIVSLICTLAVGFIWLCIGWRAMRAHERIASAVSHWVQHQIKHNPTHPTTHARVEEKPNETP